MVSKQTAIKVTKASEKPIPNAVKAKAKAGAVARPAPVPPENTNSLFKNMKVGESFYFRRKAAGVARVRASIFKKQNPNWNYVSRSEGTGVRIWRVDTE